MSKPLRLPGRMYFGGVREFDFSVGGIVGGIALFPYQLAFGVSFRVWEGSLAFRLYLGPIKFWFTWCLGGG